MNDPDRRLIDRLLDDDLSSAEAADLLQRVDTDHEAVAYLSRRALLHTGLQQSLNRKAMQRTALVAAASLEGSDANKIVVMPRTRFRRLIITWAAVASSAGAALVLFITLLSPASASPAALLQQALKAHAAALDRCYRVEIRGNNRRQDVVAQESRLWTRGDHFWNELRTGDTSVAWGRDAEGGVWFALSPAEGVRLDSNEVPEPLALACELRSLEVESLLQSILAGFELRCEPANAGAYVIHAELKPGYTHPKYRSALLEVDAESGVLRRVVLHRSYGGRPVAVVSFILVEATLINEATYTLAGHLTPDATIYDRQSGRGNRGPLIAKFLRLFRMRAHLER